MKVLVRNAYGTEKVANLYSDVFSTPFVCLFVSLRLIYDPCYFRGKEAKRRKQRGKTIAEETA